MATLFHRRRRKEICVCMFVLKYRFFYRPPYTRCQDYIDHIHDVVTVTAYIDFIAYMTRRSRKKYVNWIFHFEKSKLKNAVFFALSKCEYCIVNSWFDAIKSIDLFDAVDKFPNIKISRMSRGRHERLLRVNRLCVNIKLFKWYPVLLFLRRSAASVYMRARRVYTSYTNIEPMHGNQHRVCVYARTCFVAVHWWYFVAKNGHFDYPPIRLIN